MALRRPRLRSRLLRLLLRLALTRRLPKTSGQLRVSGTHAAITIGRDRHSIPYIEAESDADAWYGVGFCQGQDRTFQLELLLRLYRGTLAELLGPAALPLDRISRRLGLALAAERQMAGQPDAEIRANVEAFARGINAAVESGLPRRPHEFLLLRARPTPFTAPDAIGVAKLHALSLGSNWDVELARFHILCADGPQALADLDPDYLPDHPVAVPPGAVRGAGTDRLTQDLAALRSLAGGFGGSNAWALAPAKTASGRVLLANDPHLRPLLPSHWYLARVRTPDWETAGATYVGGPAFPAGHNGHSAWGVTATLADTTDLFIEQLGPDGTSVRSGSEYVPCRVRRERIRIKGHDDVYERVLETPRGPIVARGPGDEALSLRAIWLDPLPVRGMLRIHKSRSFEQFRAACADWPLSSLSMVYADTQGRIGWQMMGTVPVRRSGWGTLPQPGWQGAAGWEPVPVPHEELPWALDPASGVIATANNAPQAADGGPWLGSDFIDGFRAQRILGALGERDDWDIARTQLLQLDTGSESWREMQAAVLAAPGRGRATTQALDLLRTWDGRMDSESPAASVWGLFCASMAVAIAEARAPNASAWALGKSDAGFSPYTLLAGRRDGLTARLLRSQPDGWFEDGWAQAIDRSLAAAVEALRERNGNDPTAWAWGRVRSLVLRHPVGVGTLLGAIFNRGPLALGGDANTILQVASPPEDPLSEPLIFPSLRMVVDVGDWGNSRYCLPGGQSGNPCSPHYDDQLPLWLRGKGVPIAWEPDDVRRAAVKHLRLLPGPGPLS